MAGYAPTSAHWRAYERCDECGANRGAVCRNVDDSFSRTPCEGRVIRTSIFSDRTITPAEFRRVKRDLEDRTEQVQNLSAQIKELEAKLKRARDALGE